MQRTKIYLDDDQLRMLKHLAAEERQSVADLVRHAVDDYLARRLKEDTAVRTQLEQLLDRVRSRIPDSIPGDEIEADITAARLEVAELNKT